MNVRGAAPTYRNRPGSVGLAGVQEQGVGTSGFPRNLGRPAVSISLSTGLGGSARPKAPRPQVGVGLGRRYEDRRKGWSPPCEGNEVWRDGRQGIGAPHSTAEPGERNPAVPGEGRRCRVRGLLEGNMAGASEPDPVFTKQQQIAELAKQDPQRGLFSLAHHIDLRWLYEVYQPEYPSSAGLYQPAA